MVSKLDADINYEAASMVIAKYLKNFADACYKGSFFLVWHHTSHFLRELQRKKESTHMSISQQRAL